MDCRLPSSSVHAGNLADKNTGVGRYFLLQGIFRTQGLNLCLMCFLHWPLSHLVHYHWATWEVLGINQRYVQTCVLKFHIDRLLLGSFNTDYQESVSHQFSSVQLPSRIWLFVTPWTAARQASLSITNSWSWLKLMSAESVMPSNHLILCRPLLLLPSIFPSIRVFSNESVLHIRWAKCWSFSFSISLSNEYSGLIFFRIDWFDLLAVQETLSSLLQHYSSKATILQGSVFFIVQLSHPYMTTGKNIALTRQTLSAK